MTAKIIDGTACSKKVKEKLTLEVKDIVASGRRAPCLEVVLVGDDPASHIYVGHKEKACAEVGIASKTRQLSASVSQHELLGLIERLSADDSVDGILVQMPLPAHLDRLKIIDAIHPDKDVDGLTITNQGRLVTKQDGLFPCTPLGVMELLKFAGVAPSGKRAVVVGRSILVGMPAALMLIHAGATVTVVHSATENADAVVRDADIVVAAAGSKGLIKPSWVKVGAVVIDVGMHRDGKNLVGDVDFAGVSERASAITPVPGGVGPMTIAMLMSNCLKAYRRSKIM